MPRLRTSTGLSLLALAIGVAGTSWLSTLTSGWPGPSAHAALASRRVPPPSRVSTHPRAAAGASARRAWTPYLAVVPPTPPTPAARVSAPAVELVPLTTPADTSLSWEDLHGHLDGRALVHVNIDGDGRVTAASLVQSSGDPTLDGYALRSVQLWRFAVPNGHPDGLSGDLPMRFSSAGGGLARAL
jgi:protein TonB